MGETLEGPAEVDELDPASNHIIKAVMDALVAGKDPSTNPDVVKAVADQAIGEQASNWNPPRVPVKFRNNGDAIIGAFRKPFRRASIGIASVAGRLRRHPGLGRQGRYLPRRQRCRDMG